MAKKRSLLSRRWLWLVLIVVAALAAAWIFLGDGLRRTGQTGTAYAAHVGCSCRYIGGRSLEDCARDKLEGMELVGLSEDEATQSVTATIPFVATDTATYRKGYGCLLKEWED